jgi:hypothetical protein
MTERRKRPGPLPVIVTTIATFLAIAVLLAVQLQAGRDPVLGTARVATLSAGQHPKVVTRSSGGGQKAQPGPRAVTSRAVTTRTSGAIGRLEGGEVEDD